MSYPIACILKELTATVYNRCAHYRQQRYERRVRKLREAAELKEMKLIAAPPENDGAGTSDVESDAETVLL